MKAILTMVCVVAAAAAAAAAAAVSSASWLSQPEHGVLISCPSCFRRFDTSFSRDFQIQSFNIKEKLSSFSVCCCIGSKNVSNKRLTAATRNFAASKNQFCQRVLTAICTGSSGVKLVLT